MTTSVLFPRCPHRRDVILFIVIACVMNSVTPTKVEELHFMSRFPPSPSADDQDAVKTSSTPYHGGKFQDIFIKWIKQVKVSRDVSVITVLAKVTVTDELPTVFWFVNGRAVDETNHDYPQTTTAVDNGLLTTISIFKNASVTSLKVYHHLDVFGTETTINVQDMDSNIDSYPQTILEHGTDVALALTAEEKVTFSPNEDVDITMRFFSEDLFESTFDVQDVILLRGAEIFTPAGNPDVLSLRNMTKDEVPTWMHTRERYPGTVTRPITPLSLYQILHIDNSVLNNKTATLFVEAGYVSNTTCRLFGGQKISRRLDLVPRGQ